MAVSITPNKWLAEDTILSRANGIDENEPEEQALISFEAIWIPQIITMQLSNKSNFIVSMYGTDVLWIFKNFNSANCFWVWFTGSCTMLGWRPGKHPHESESFISTSHSFDFTNTGRQECTDFGSPILNPAWGPSQCSRQSPFLSNMNNILGRHVPNYKPAPSTHPLLKTPAPCILEVDRFSSLKKEIIQAQVSHNWATMTINISLVSLWWSSHLGGYCIQQS